MGKSHLRLDEPAEAVEAYRRALADDPENQAAIKGLSRAQAALADSK